MTPDRDHEPVRSTDTSLENMLGLLDATMQQAEMLQGDGNDAASLFLANAACEALSEAISENTAQIERLSRPIEEPVPVGCVADWDCDL